MDGDAATSEPTGSRIGPATGVVLGAGCGLILSVLPGVEVWLGLVYGAGAGLLVGAVTGLAADGVARGDPMRVIVAGVVSGGVVGGGMGAVVGWSAALPLVDAGGAGALGGVSLGALVGVLLVATRGRRGDGPRTEA